MFNIVAYVGAADAAAGSTVPATAVSIKKYKASANDSVTVSKPVAVNENSISVENTDLNNKDNYDGESVGYGWVGTYDSSTANDEKITVTITG